MGWLADWRLLVHSDEKRPFARAHVNDLPFGRKCLIAHEAELEVLILCADIHNCRHEAGHPILVDFGLAIVISSPGFFPCTVQNKKGEFEMKVRPLPRASIQL